MVQYSSEATWQTHACDTRVTRVWLATVLASGCACTREWLREHSQVHWLLLASARAHVREYNVIISLQAWPNVPIKEH